MKVVTGENSEYAIKNTRKKIKPFISQALRNATKPNTKTLLHVESLFSRQMPSTDACRNI
jgi:hypothetical protein